MENEKKKVQRKKRKEFGNMDAIEPQININNE
jgi:hypothetical protein